MGNFRYPQRAALASAALLFFSGCVQSQAPIVDASGDVRRGAAPAVPVQQASAPGVEMLLGQVQALREEIMALRGTVEEQGYQLETLKQQSLERYMDLDRRLSGEGGTVAPALPAPGAPAPTATAPTAGSTVPSSPPESSQPTQAAQPTAPAPAPTAAMTASNEMDAYRDAYSRVKAQDFVGAVGAFEAFLATYPNSALVPNAHYWLGELHMQSPQDLDKAQQAFQHVLTDFSSHDKAPDALFKLGRIEFMRGNRAKAQELLQQVIDEYGSSGSMAPQLAKQFLDQNFR